ncbi:MAG: hydrogenase iron-sulfur subunit [Candidatus Hodarchaeales archaeon]|jgi:F420-non-reducing hydrogenase iron-sulfur subunit
MITEQVDISKDDKIEFTPTIIGFYCRWCTHAAADLAGTSRIQIPANVIGIRVPCSGRVDPSFIYQAFLKGADGVLIGGCHPGDCHYGEGNYSAFRRTKMLQQVIKEFGIEKERVRIEWISASEANKLKQVLDEFTETILSLGPLDWPDHLKKTGPKHVASGD